MKQNLKITKLVNQANAADPQILYKAGNENFLGTFDECQFLFAYSIRTQNYTQCETMWINEAPGFPCAVTFCAKPCITLSYR